MRVSYNWLKQYIDPGVDAAEMGRLYTAAGLELDEVVSRGDQLEGVKVARVLSCENVAGSDHLHLLSVDAGQAEPLTIVCGAPNIAAGQIVPCATVGTVLPGGFEISARKTFGVLSCGMICSQKELGLSEDHSGIWVLDEYFAGQQAPIGAELADVLDLRDDILVIELTPNRSDCLGMLNCAHEAAAITGKTVSEPDLSYPEEGPQAKDEISIHIEDYQLCPRYVGRIVKNVKIGPSPLWMQNYLLAAGMRPINNVVDISNFVMLEMNQPLHTFDYQALRGKQIIVRGAQAGEKMQTLDGKNHEFAGGEILICDAERPICIGGVMGGLDTEVEDSTTDILVESACFNPVAIRRASRRHGIPSEASQRFEKGVDVASCDLAARRAVQFMVKYCGGVADQGLVEDIAPQYAAGFTPTQVRLRPQRVNYILGTDYSEEEIREVMQRLNFAVTEQDGLWLVSVPSYRQDIELEEDLIEEVARLKGYDLIPQTMPVNACAGGRTPKQKLQLQLSNLCADLGLHETVNYSFISPKDADRMQLPAEHDWRRMLVIDNPLSEEQSVMRRSLLPGLLSTAARNLARRHLDLRFFETGMVFVPDKDDPAHKQPQEINTIAMLLAGTPGPTCHEKAPAYDFFYLKGLLEAAFTQLGVSGVEFSRAARPFLHPGRSAEIVIDGHVAGIIGEMHPLVIEAYDLAAAGRTIVAELELDAIFNNVLSAANKPHELPKYPASTRDIALLGACSVPAVEVEAAIRSAGGEYLESVNLFDMYDQAPIPAGQRSLAFALQFRADERTLTDAEVDDAFRNIVQAAEQLGYKLR